MLPPHIFNSGEESRSRRVLPKEAASEITALHPLVVSKERLPPLHSILKPTELWSSTSPSHYIGSATSEILSSAAKVTSHHALGVLSDSWSLLRTRRMPTPRSSFQAIRPNHDHQSLDSQRSPFLPAQHTTYLAELKQSSDFPPDRNTLPTKIRKSTMPISTTTSEGCIPYRLDVNHSTHKAEATSSILMYSSHIMDYQEPTKTSCITTNAAETNRPLYGFQDKVPTSKLDTHSSSRIHSRAVTRRQYLPTYDMQPLTKPQACEANHWLPSHRTILTETRHNPQGVRHSKGLARMPGIVDSSMRRQDISLSEPIETYHGESKAQFFEEDTDNGMQKTTERTNEANMPGGVPIVRTKSGGIICGLIQGGDSFKAGFNT